MKSTLSVTGAADFHDAVQMGSTLSITGETQVGGAAKLASTLSVEGNAMFSSNVTIDGPKLKIPINDTHPSTTETGLVHYNSTTKVFEGLVDYGSGVKSWVPFGGVSDQDRNTKITAPGEHIDELRFFASNGDTARMMMNSNALSLNINMHIAGDNTLLVGGDAKFSSELSVNGDAYFKDTVKMNSNLSVNGTGYIASTLVGADDVTFHGKLSVGNDVTIAETKHLHIDNIKPTNTTADILTLDAGHVHIKGNLDIEGTWNSVSVNTEEIMVEDRRVVLGASSNAFGSNNDIFDADYTSSGAGLEIFGVPTSADTYEGNNSNLWEKSLLWNHGNGGIKEMGQWGDDNSIESFWELKGGSFRVTSVKSNMDEISFGFRINSSDQLELHKIKKTGQSVIHTRIAKFGMVL